MLVENDYESWKIRIHRYIRGKPNGKSDNEIPSRMEPTPHPISKWPDTQAEIILRQGLPRHISTYSIRQSPERNLGIMWKSYSRISRPFTKENRKSKIRFDEYERFRAIGNESIHDYFVPEHDISTTPICYRSTLILKAYEPHAKKTLKKQEQSTSIVDPLAYVAHTTSAPTLSSPSTPKESSVKCSNSRSRGKKVICYNCRGEGHVARQCKEPKRKMDSQYFKDKALLMEAKEKGDVLDAEAEAFLADVECTAPYDQPQALTTTNMFQANHEDAYDSDVDEGPNAAVAFMANLSSTSAANSQVNEVHSNDNQIFDNVDYQLNQEMHQGEHLDSDAETEIDDNTIPYHQYLLDIEAQNVPTEVSADTSDKVSMIAILTDLQTQLDGHAKVKLDLEHKVRLEQALVIQRNKRNAELVQENDLLKSTLSGKKKTIMATADLHKDLQIYTRNCPVNSKLLSKERASQTSNPNETCHSLPVIKKSDLQFKFSGILRNVNAAFFNLKNTLKDTITSLRIQLDGLKVENVSLKRRYDELSKANTHSRTAYTEKLSAFTAEHTKLKAQVTGTTSNGPSTSETPKVLAPGMYNLGSKYIPPPKHANWVKPTPLPKKKQVTFQEPPRTSHRPTQKPPVQQNKKPNVPVNLSTRTQPAIESRNPMPKSHTRNHRILPSKSVNTRRAADHNRRLNVVDHNQFVIRSLKSVNTKTPQAKHSVNHTKKVWKATRNHNVNTTKTAWRPTRKVVGSVKPQWKPTGRHFALYDNCPLTRIVEPIVEPLELTPSDSSSSTVTMISRFNDCKLSDRKAGSKGLSGIFEC
ncbi:reverse transcriptase domain-containing protein [Tanacetum coccineum]